MARLLIDAYNIARPHGTGVATYARIGALTVPGVTGPRPYIVQAGGSESERFAGPNEDFRLLKEHGPVCQVAPARIDPIDLEQVDLSRSAPKKMISMC
ncbi:hypothetical protein [Erythrobacter cryptus]|uniref:hypothetical protein n=1 Tax=Erythrobacter cryptus TaxID=196588 RepID=UPI0012EC73C1|nr:hypothetical protein [Erythrobacter cryptus]